MHIFLFTATASCSPWASRGVLGAQWAARTLASPPPLLAACLLQQSLSRPFVGEPQTQPLRSPSIHDCYHENESHFVGPSCWRPVCLVLAFSINCLESFLEPSSPGPAPLRCLPPVNSSVCTGEGFCPYHTQFKVQSKAFATFIIKKTCTFHILFLNCVVNV